MPTLLDTAEFALAKTTLDETLQRIEKARQDRLESVRKYLETVETDLARVKQQALELPAAIARYRAEIARLEATTGADILREAMSAHEVVLHAQPPGEVVEVQSPKPTAESFIPGLPPEALRKVWPEWEDEAGDVVTFKDDLYHWTHWHPSTPVKRIADVTWIGIKLRPVGNTRAHVEALAQQAQTPKPHACPRCDEGMRGIELTKNVYVKPDGISDECWGAGERRTATIIDSEDSGVIGVPMRSDGSHPWYLEASQYRFTRPDVPPPSEWCDGSGKGGAE